MKIILNLLFGIISRKTIFAGVSFCVCVWLRLLSPFLLFDLSFVETPQSYFVIVVRRQREMRLCLKEGLKIQKDLRVGIEGHIWKNARCSGILHPLATSLRYSFTEEYCQQMGSSHSNGFGVGERETGR